ncbi:hypothetical protein E5288_WYG006723 [Bos mutus]|uniref:Centrosome-associated FAM110 C-terminal domain-containing protein n=1 Tax=Bos mutus TaxID=72004 RepID=A0A6B0RED6_9CETA|nr:hypothetical protein [Bos mutus]
MASSVRMGFSSRQDKKIPVETAVTLPLPPPRKLKFKGCLKNRKFTYAIFLYALVNISCYNVNKEKVNKGAARAEPGPSTAPAPARSVVTPPRVPAAPRGAELLGARRRGLQRSQSDLSSRYSASLAESDTFFQYCGLEPDVVEALGRENFSAESDRGALKVRSVSVATSDSGFSRRSGEDEGLQEEELAEQVPSTTSVVERNARIIKWLYTCKKAKETPGQGLQGPA